MANLEQKNTKKEDLIYESDSMKQYGEYLNNFESILSQNPLESPFLEANLLEFSVRTAKGFFYLNNAYHIKKNLNYMLNGANRLFVIYQKLNMFIGQLKQSMEMLQYDIDNGQYYRMELIPYIEKYYSKDDYTNSLFLKLEHGFIPIFNMYMDIIEDVRKGILGLIRNNQYTIQEWVDALNDQFDYYWKVMWDMQGKWFLIDMSIMSEGKSDFLNQKRKELYDRLKKNRLALMHYFSCDKNGQNCDYNEFIHKLFMSSSEWTIKDLNDYFDIIIQLEYVESIINNKPAPERHLLFDMKVNQEISEDNDLYNDFHELFVSLYIYVKAPYTPKQLDTAFRALLLGEETPLQKEFIDFITNTRAKKGRVGNIGMNHFFKLINFLNSEDVIHIGNIDKHSFIKDIIGAHWDEEWKDNMYDKCLSRNWDDGINNVDVIKNELISFINRHVEK